MEVITIIVASVLISLVGYASVRTQIKMMQERLDFVRSYKDLFVDFLESEGQNRDKFAILIFHSNKVALILGGFNILSSYTPSFARLLYTNYPVIPNVLNELRQSIDQRFGEPWELIQIIEGVLLRYMGYMSDQINNIQKEKSNPVACFREGIAWVLALPIKLLSTLGFVDSTKAGNLISSRLFRLVGALFALITLLSCTVTIVVEWEKFLKVIEDVLT